MARLKIHHKVTIATLIFLSFLIFGLGLSFAKMIPQAQYPDISLKIEKLLRLTAAFGLTFCGLVYLYLSRRLARPLRYVNASVESVKAGHTPKTMHFPFENDVTALASCVDEMADNIAARIEQVNTRKNQLEAVFLSMSEGVMVLSGDGQIVLINETLKKILRVEREFSGRQPLEVIRDMEVQDIVDEVLCMHKGVTTREISVLLPEEKILRVHAAPVIHGGKADGAVLVFHDITDLRKLETVRRDFVANVSHELRTPLANIKGYAETLLEGAIEDKENARDFLKIIYSESDHLSKLVDDLLKLARHEDGRSALDLKPCNIVQLLDWALAGLAQQIKQKELKVRLDIPQDLPQVRADDSAVAQIFLNLIENAVKYNKPGGLITVSARANDGWVEVCLADTGIGIPEQDLLRVFERFYRVDKSHGRDTPGTGLGLSIVKHIVQGHGGEIKMQSQLGQGTTVCFTLPQA